MKTLLLSILPALLALGAPAFVALLAWAQKLLHSARLAKDAAAKSIRDKFVATLLDLVDDFASTQAAGIEADIKDALTDGAVTPVELKAIATKEWVRVQGYFKAGFLAKVAAALGLSLQGVGELAVKSITDKLSFRLASKK